ncbi:hypothetical protein DEU56DRAFT_820713 [Suillus clintonianus]|uniref:uncharacterized protein n=1 Tax=Suillus clintonianus TaxID=1904413 RepID=UPI001B8795D0|nr:uncharacterized protein DEU56DRAFT_820713 [Suillus clintonianus]KAG2127215.1 hypothetical protein DEU56DRAFT_820713 [Suillus clintonianus]
MRFVLLFQFCRMLPVCTTGIYDSELIGSVSGVEEWVRILMVPYNPTDASVFSIYLASSAPRVSRLRSSGSSLINSTTDSLSEEVPTG